MEIHHGVFGSFSVVPDDRAYLTATIVLSGRQSECGLHIDSDLTKAALHNALALLETLENLDRQARGFIADASGDDEKLITSFSQEQLDEMPEESLKKLNLLGIDVAGFLKRLKLRAACIRSEEPETFGLVLDYCIGQEFSDQLLCVYFDDNGTIVFVSHES